MLVISGAGGKNSWLDLPMSRSSTLVTDAAVLFTSKIFLSESEGESAGSEQFVEDAYRIRFEVTARSEPQELEEVA